MHGFDPSSEQISDAQIDGAEALLSIEFPSSYRELAREYGGSFGDVEFSIDRPSGGSDRWSIGLVLSLRAESPNSVYSRMSSWQEHELAPKLIPIAEDGGGNYLCLDYRRGNEPQVVFYFHELTGEDGIMFVCQTFDEFLTRLIEPSDDGV